MSLLAVGSTAYDTIHAPTGDRERCLGGSATHFSVAARFFSPVRYVSVVGEDFAKSDLAFLEERGMDLDGLEIAAGATMHWTGKYHADMNQRDTLSIELNTFGDFSPKLPAHWRDTDFVFLANGHPSVQAAALEQIDNPRLVVADTMDLWIETANEPLHDLLRRVDALILNDEEAKQLAKEHNLITAGRALLELGPKLVLVKKGEHGCFLFSEFFQCALPSYPTENVVDPTGAGDAFAGGFMGHLAETGRVSLWNLKRAMAYGTVTASLQVEGFGTDGLALVERPLVEQRYAEFLQFISF